MNAHDNRVVTVLLSFEEMEILTDVLRDVFNDETLLERLLGPPTGPMTSTGERAQGDRRAWAHMANSKLVFALERLKHTEKTERERPAPARINWFGDDDASPRDGYYIDDDDDEHRE